MGIELDVEVDTSAALAMLQDGLDNMTESIGEALDQGGSQMKDAAQGMVRVRTGYLRSTITYEVDGLTLTLTALASYAKYVEFGHHQHGTGRFVGPFPFIRPAFYQIYPQLQDAIAAAVANAFGQ
jgi:hypothetical protein